MRQANAMCGFSGVAFLGLGADERTDEVAVQVLDSLPTLSRFPEFV